MQASAPRPAVAVRGKLPCPICNEDYPELWLSRHLWAHGHRPVLIACIVKLVGEATVHHSSHHHAGNCWLCKREAELARIKQSIHNVVDV